MSEARSMTVTLTIVVEALQGDDLFDAGFFEGIEEDDGEPLTNLIADYSPVEIADLLPSAITHPDNEIFAGSGLFVKLGEITVIKSEWTPHP